MHISASAVGANECDVISGGPWERRGSAGLGAARAAKQASISRLAGRCAGRPAGGSIRILPASRPTRRIRLNAQTRHSESEQRRRPTPSPLSNLQLRRLAAAAAAAAAPSLISSQRPDQSRRRFWSEKISCKYRGTIKRTGIEEMARKRGRADMSASQLQLCNCAVVPKVPKRLRFSATLAAGSSRNLCYIYKSS